MTSSLSLANASLSSQGPTADLSLAPGQLLAVFGPPNSGKSRLLKLAHEGGTLPQGTIISRVPAAHCAPGCVNGKTTPAKCAALAGGSTSSASAGEALYLLQLEQVHNKPVAELSGGVRAMCDLLPCLASNARLLLFDASFDTLDPWSLERALVCLRKRLQAGAAAVVVTGSARVAQMASLLLVLDRGTPRFLGTANDLLERSQLSEVTVKTHDQPGVRALVEPLQIKLEELKDGVRFTAPKGQELAAKLLLAGYGDVEAIVVRRPTLLEAIRTLVQPRSSV